MTRMNLMKRIDKLEAQTPSPCSVVHRVIYDKGESMDEALARYERESGRHINEDDLVIIRVIV